MGPSPRKSDARVPALDAETLKDFLDGRLEGAERARVLAILKDLPDDDFKVFTDASSASAARSMRAFRLGDDDTHPHPDPQ